MVKVICLYQKFKSASSMKKEGVGDCRICTPSPDNAKCLDYTPINLWVIDVK